jgi:hypothetical protein
MTNRILRHLSRQWPQLTTFQPCRKPPLASKLLKKIPPSTHATNDINHLYTDPSSDLPRRVFMVGGISWKCWLFNWWRNFQLLWNQKVHLHVHEGQPFDTILSQWINCIPSHPISPKIGFKYYALSTPWPPTSCFPEGFPTKILYAVLISPCMLHALPIASPLV